MAHAAFGEGGAGAKRGSGPGSEVEGIVGEILDADGACRPVRSREQDRKIIVLVKRGRGAF